jgi:hypothetical protein
VSPQTVALHRHVKGIGARPTPVSSLVDALIPSSAATSRAARARRVVRQVRLPVSSRLPSASSRQTKPTTPAWNASIQIIAGNARRAALTTHAFPSSAMPAKSATRADASMTRRLSHARPTLKVAVQMRRPAALSMAAALACAMAARVAATPVATHSTASQPGNAARIRRTRSAAAPPAVVPVSATGVKITSAVQRTPVSCAKPPMSAA